MPIPTLTRQLLPLHTIMVHAGRIADLEMLRKTAAFSAELRQCATYTVLEVSGFGSERKEITKGQRLSYQDAVLAKERLHQTATRTDPNYSRFGGPVFVIQREPQDDLMEVPVGYLQRTNALNA